MTERATALDRLWAGWRSTYISGGTDTATDADRGGTLFERILASGLSDRETYILWRGERCFALLNAYPYTTGHLLVLPKRGVPDLTDLDDEETVELWLGVRDAVGALRTAYEPSGVNVGLNLGGAAGGGVPDHLHVHCLARWSGDSNFMTTVAEARVLPEPLDVTWSRLREVWPTTDSSGS